MGSGKEALRIPIGCYRLDFQGGHPLVFPEFAGAAWRGALGHALKRAVCTTHERSCAACLLYHSCTYPYIFETPAPPTACKMRRYNKVPHPFVLRPETEAVDDSNVCRIFLTLFGNANRYLPTMLYALTRAASSKRGIAGNQLDLMCLSQEKTPGLDEWQVIYRPGEPLLPLPPATVIAPPAPPIVTIQLRTPLRVKRDGHRVGPNQFEFSDLFNNLLRRISMLTYFHNHVPLETNFRQLIDVARTVVAKTDLSWKDWNRYSSRQKTSMRLGGLIGHIEVASKNIEPFWPFLWLGQWTHAGTAATMGLGHYAITSLSDRTVGPI